MHPLMLDFHLHIVRAHILLHPTHAQIAFRICNRQALLRRLRFLR